jgi:hypothetical protein
VLTQPLPHHCLTQSTYGWCVRAGRHTLADRVLLINLSPAVLLQPALYALFKNTCVEFPCAWHTPAGPAVLPLEKVIHVAACVHKWLLLDADHVVCLHARAPAAAHPASLLRFVTACYLTYWCVGPAHTPTWAAMAVHMHTL